MITRSFPAHSTGRCLKPVSELHGLSINMSWGMQSTNQSSLFSLAHLSSCGWFLCAAAKSRAGCPVSVSPCPRSPCVCVPMSTLPLCLCPDVHSLAITGGQCGGGCLWPAGQASIFSLVLMLGLGPVWNLVVAVCYINNLGCYSIKISINIIPKLIVNYFIDISWNQFSDVIAFVLLPLSTILPSLGLSIMVHRQHKHGGFWFCLFGLGWVGFLFLFFTWSGFALMMVGNKGLGVL